MYRASDVVFLDGLVIPCDKIHCIQSFSVIIGGTAIWKIPFNLIMKLSKVQKKTNSDKSINKDSYIIMFPNSLFSDDNSIKLIALQFHIVGIMVEANDSFNYKLMIKRQYLETEARRTMAQISHEIIINQYKYWTFQNETRELYSIDPENISTGIFIESNLPIKKYILKLNGQNHSEYNRNMIQLYNCLVSKRQWTKAHSMTLNFILRKIIPTELINIIENHCKINEYLYWFPIRAGDSFNDKNTDCTMNFSAFGIQNVDLQILVENQKDNVNNNIKICVKSKNILMIMSGMGGTKFNHSPEPIKKID